ncbi:hypothetical protein JB92DRAFT_2958263 [Gautieria morchelliformis]|nr:hypothetical protein JB92DRAFT_2958263 [Gautieria morchelliformis]
MPVGSPIRLSSQLTSTYRLFLRATSAAVLHHPTATRNIRKLYRPIFDEAANVDVQVKTTRDPQKTKLLEQWLVTWNKRVDNTLELLHSSATTRGLSHRLTRNIGFLTHAYLKSRMRKGQVWDPQLPASAPIYSIRPGKVPTAKEKKQQSRAAFDATVFHSVGQVVRLAEGQSNISLGRLSPVSVPTTR